MSAKHLQVQFNKNVMRTQKQALSKLQNFWQLSKRKAYLVPRRPISKVLKYMYNLNFTKAFIPFRVFSGKISSEMECFRASRNQKFFCPRTMVAVGITQLEQSLYP